MSEEYTSELGIKFDQWRRTDEGRQARQTGEFNQEFSNDEAVEKAFLAGAMVSREALIAQLKEAFREDSLYIHKVDA